MSRSRRRSRRDGHYEPLDTARLREGWRRLVDKRDGQWYVQPISGERAVKTYVCPGCGGEIPPAMPHVVAWRADGIFGADDDLAARRHWHRRCWEIAP